MAKFCASCGTKLVDGATFCTECGARVEQPSGGPQVSAPAGDAQQPLSALHQMRVDELTAEGNRHFEQGNYLQTIEAYTQVIQLTPQDASAYVVRCSAYNQLGNHQQAIQDASRAIEINPQCAEAYLSRGTAYFQCEDHQQALRDLNRAIELGPQNAAGSLLRGMCHYKLGDNQKAEADFALVMQITSDPNLTQTAMTMLGVLGAGKSSKRKGLFGRGRG